MMNKFSIVILPEFTSIIAFVLTLLCILSGKDGNSESYHVLAVNMTALRAPNDYSTAQLGLSDWYSLHILDSCKGNVSTWHSYTQCTTSSSDYQWYLGDIVQADLDAGESGLNLEDLNFSPKIQETFEDDLNLFLHVSFVFYILGAVFQFFAFSTGILCFWAPVFSANMAFFAVPATIFLLIASSLATAVHDQGSAVINEHGQAIGISAYGGGPFLNIAWTAFVLSLLSSFAWILAGLMSAWYMF